MIIIHHATTDIASKPAAVVLSCNYQGNKSFQKVSEWLTMNYTCWKMCIYKPFTAIPCKKIFLSDFIQGEFIMAN